MVHTSTGKHEILTSIISPDGLFEVIGDALEKSQVPLYHMNKLKINKDFIKFKV